MFITTTLTGLATVAVTGAAIGTAAGIVIRPWVEYLAAAITARFTKNGKDFYVSTIPEGAFSTADQSSTVTLHNFRFH